MIEVVVYNAHERKYEGWDDEELSTEGGGSAVPRIGANDGRGLR
jgi:hypothetical protein